MIFFEAKTNNLSTQENVHRLLVILGAPILRLQDGSEFIDYSEIHTNAITNHESVLTILGTLPALVTKLLDTQQLELSEVRWSDSKIFNLIETLTSEEFLSLN